MDRIVGWSMAGLGVFLLVAAYAWAALGVYWFGPLGAIAFIPSALVTFPIIDGIRECINE